MFAWPEETLVLLNACCFASASLSLPSDPSLRPEGARLTGSDFCFLSFTMLVLHPTSSCDICYDTYGQGNPASTIPCGHIFCFRCVRRQPKSPSSKHEAFHSSVFSRVLASTGVFPSADRACVHCVGRSSRAPMSRNSERPTLGMAELK